MVKVISLSEEAYRKLKVLKGMKSFSEAVVELIEKKANKNENMAEFVGIWKDDANEWKAIEKKIYNDRKKAKMKEVNL